MNIKKTAPINVQTNKGGLSKQQLNFTKFLLKSLTYLTAGIMAITSLALALYSITGGC